MEGEGRREGGSELGMGGRREGGSEGRREGRMEGGKEDGNPSEAGYNQLVYHNICIHLLNPHWTMPRQAVISTQQHKLSH